MTRFLSPRSLAEAVELLAADPRMRLIAGCTDLLVADPVDRARIGPVLDLLAIPELEGVRLENGCVEIGATTSFSTLRADPAVCDRLPALAAAAAAIGGWQIQNRATIGGNVVNASPAGDSLPVLLALEATAIVVGSDGEREIPCIELFTGYRSTALRAGEVLARLRIPVPPDGTLQAFHKVGTRRAQAISKVVICLVGRIDQGTVVEYRLAAGSVAAVPVRLTEVERRVVGQPASADLGPRAGELAAAAVEPIDDVRSTAAYRRFALSRVVSSATRALVASQER